MKTMRRRAYAKANGFVYKTFKNRSKETGIHITNGRQGVIQSKMSDWQYIGIVKELVEARESKV